MEDVVEEESTCFETEEAEDGSGFDELLIKTKE